ncbi:cell filamentation protein Fic [bacterium (Candidatus Blackallbacteria) CG17_big_fil_post_rev_8_21_14_2_50_48_46]|uniref:Cell filamentation protein Fic n=1 Tax=bacterium (Candidatus Blackallbacteria) CG17_big_fil_post_rev_8_21_14_2_50_48_46 TaxID=2014261 RepID=A0A2M7G1N3_9BACT|nr:MAG: cell filamentation protein Fic [bacterium (Candidatus Blackallbacteria) CG18_big_fil_WC_8_21_14_2_50_49_26]PIW15527.1 MAG: cell filamentation protein Fic [bacterium (Candidatus Blackallbacteria) CG17_big_fil_post_rev_8_21_14_2_50_48_46]PIW48572.1 MAG: cell filamentation protein Fic [bacterium (Candidatus Blackallbacteria) CG13_big_fil_rev_8_21_14_2_50_49_14]
MLREIQGYYVTISTVGEKAKAYVPAALPPQPPIEWTPELRNRFDQALLALGRLDSVTRLLPDTVLFLYMYVRKEAVLSSMIEGTQSSLSDLLLFELDEVPGVPLDDVEEVSNYVAALMYGLKRLKEGFPLSLRLIREIHEVLLSQGRGSRQSPGEFRRSQNWIGGTRPGNAAFVPPPADLVMECMGHLESFLHDQPEPTPILLKAALAHVQFETIHPFLDGNGRLGRLLITLLLCEQGVLREPLLYLSLFFKTHRQYYYELLTRVRMTGDWEAWLDFFAEAVVMTANQAVTTAEELLALANESRDKINTLGRAAPSCQAIHRVLLETPLSTVAKLCEKTGLSPATVNKGLGHLGNLSIVSELTAQKRNRLFSYTRYIEIMNQGTELPTR